MLFTAELRDVVARKITQLEKVRLGRKCLDWESKVTRSLAESTY